MLTRQFFFIILNIMILNYPTKEQIEHKNRVEMLKNDIKIEITNHKDEMDKLIPDKSELIVYKAVIEYENGKNVLKGHTWDVEWYKDYYNDSEFYTCITTLRTAFNTISLRIELDKMEKIHYIIQVQSSYSCWKKLERLSTEETTTTFEWERLKRLIIYAKKVQHIIFSREEQVQKIMAVAVKEGQLLKDFT